MHRRRAAGPRQGGSGLAELALNPFDLNFETDDCAQHTVDEIGVHIFHPPRHIELRFVVVHKVLLAGIDGLRIVDDDGRAVDMRRCIVPRGTALSVLYQLGVI